MKVALIVYFITSYGAVNTRQLGDFDTYQDCATHAFALTEPLKPLYPDTTIKWECEKK